MTEQAPITVRGLRVRYGSTMALAGVNLDLDTGVHGLLGPNGAGKTTLIRVLATVAPVPEGNVTILGHDAGGHSARTEIRRQLGYLPQAFGYFPGFTVTEFVEYFAWLKEIPKKAVPGAVERAVTRVGLVDKANAKMRTLSGGMLRRAGIAQAIVNEPALVLLDEPTSGLDPEQRVDFRALLRELGSTSTVLVSTHLVEDVTAACNRVALLNAGRVVFRGTPDELAASGTDDDLGDTPIERGYTAMLRHTKLMEAL